MSLNEFSSKIPKGSPLQTDGEPYYYTEEPVQPRWSLIPRVSGVSTISTFFQWPRAKGIGRFHVISKSETNSFLETLL